MTVHTSATQNDKKRPDFPLSTNPPKIAKHKRSNSDSSSIAMEDPIDRYRDTLKAEGCIEIDIPDDLQKKIDVVNKILRGNQRNHHIDETKLKLESYLEKNQNHLSKVNYNMISSMSDDFNSFTQKTLEKIFSDKNVAETTSVTLTIKNNHNNSNAFHKDFRIISKLKSNITIIYPMLENKGTAYVPYDKKNKYAETAKNHKFFKLQDLNDFYDYKTVDPTDIKYADPSKIFIFLCRKASEDLGSDYDDKSLIHAVPEPDDAKEPRIFMLGRFFVEEKTTQP